MAFASAVVAHFGPGLAPSVLRPAPRQVATREASLDEAMDRYAQGEQAAFAILYGGLEMRLRAFLMRLTGASAVADDLLQETFMRIHRARGSFEPGGAVVPWAYAIARNAWLDHTRSVRARNKREGDPPSDDDGSAIEPATGPDADSEQAVIARETAALVERVLRGLPPAQREAFVLLRYEGLSVQDAAEILGSTPTAVKLRAFRAYGALREALGRPGEKGGGDGA